MNYKMIFYTLGNILKVLAIVLILPLIVSLICHDGQYWTFLVPIAISLVLGFAIGFKKPKNSAFYGRESLIICGFAWIIISLIGCLPFILSKQIPYFIDAFFETVSGLTTTGSSILTDVESLTKSMLFWRSFTHWIGGMGVLVFVLAFAKSDGQNIYLLKAESPGPKVGKLVSKVRHTAGILYIIYAALTILEMIFLVCGKMPFFDAVCNSLATAGTGGFAIINAGIGGYNVYCQSVIGVFMILFGVNFNFYFLLVMRKFKQAFKSEEVIWYFVIIFVAVAAITTNLCLAQKIETSQEFGTNLKDAFFQVGAVITTTGFATTDFAQWPMFSQTILFILMFVGACAGSTGGGMKVSRFLILFKSIKKSIKKLIHPHSVTIIKLEGEKVEDDVIKGTSVYVGIIFLCFLIGTLLVSLNGFDFTTNATAVASCLNNIGPGLSQVGPMCNYSAFSPLSKLVLIALMLIGRLEIYPILALFSPTTWKK